MRIVSKNVSVYTFSLNDFHNLCDKNDVIAREIFHGIGRHWQTVNLSIVGDERDFRRLADNLMSSPDPYFKELGRDLLSDTF
jgi:hypothetical protein